MGGLSLPVRSSLDRLKALDGLPDLNSQLQEAHELCSHAARAEMIIRWLLAKSKASAEARGHPRAWDLFSACVRLLSAQKMASLLGQHGFIEVVQIACGDADVSKDRLSAMSRLLDLLLVLAEAPDAQAIKALLNFESASAATLCGNWLQHVYRCSVDHRGTNPQSVDAHLLQPALKLWAMRKRSDADDELFNEKCLVPASAMVVSLRQLERQGESKRKRGRDNAGPVQICLSSLESFIAKHTILPARVLFLKQQNHESRRDDSRQPPKNSFSVSPSALQEALDPLKSAITGNYLRHAVEAVPLVFDIALRSVATPTPKQRLNEMPWIENLFKALRSCISTQDRHSKNRTLTAMLAELGRQGLSLQSQILTELVWNEAFPAEETETVDWKLIAGVIRLDPNVFGNRTILSPVFDAITMEERPQGTLASGIKINPRASHLLKDDIVIPIMKSYAQNRNLRTFVDLWGKQLSRPQNLLSVSLWNTLGISLAEILEDSLPLEDLLGLFDDFAIPLHEMSSRDRLDDHCNFNASLTITEAVIRGVKSEAWVDELFSRLDKLVHGLFYASEANGLKVTSTVPLQLWQLLTRLFESWFPRWVGQIGDSSIVAEKGAQLMSTSVFQIAQTQATGEPPSSQPIEVAKAAQLLVATLMNVFQKYKDHQDCMHAVTAAAGSLGAGGGPALDVLLKYPTLIMKLPPMSRVTVFSTLLSSTQENVEALVQCVQLSEDPAAFDDLVTASLDEIKTYCAGGSSSDAQCLSFCVFSGIGLAKLSRKQHTDLLDAALQLPPIDAAHLLPMDLQRRLALILALLPTAPKDIKVLKSNLLMLFRESEPAEDNPATASHLPLDTLDNLRLLQEITSKVTQAWLAPSKQQRDHDQLKELSKTVKRHIRKAIKSKNLSTQRASLTFLKTILATLENGNLEQTDLNLVHQDKKTMESYFEVLLKEMESSSSTEPHPCILDALVVAPRAGRTPDLDKRIAKNALNIFESIEEPTGTAHDIENALQIRTLCFRLICKYAGGDALVSVTELAERALQQDLTATQHAVVLSSYVDVARSTNIEGKLSAFKSLRDRLQQSSWALLLHRELIMATDKSELNPTSDVSSDIRMSGPELLQQILEAASNGTNLHVRRTALQSVVSMAKSNSYMFTRAVVERAISVLHGLLDAYNLSVALYTDICNCVTAMFAHQRFRLPGQFHLLVPLFQALVSGLFGKSSPSTSGSLAVVHGRSVARLLESFCNPRPMHHRGKTSALVDEARKSRAQAGQYAHYILHHYCSRILTGSLGDGVREALLPGLWAMIESIEANNPDGIKSLSAAMNNSERAVLRTVYDDWKRFGKWEGL